jgi:hypothetical protein
MPALVRRHSVSHTAELGGYLNQMRW